LGQGNSFGESPLGFHLGCLCLLIRQPCAVASRGYKAVRESGSKGATPHVHKRSRWTLGVL
jgi:hypothetical protein